ncbi:MAG: DNA primase [Lentisphaeria bacterium]|nr:DNA primase [Lentisphaeria bacterium]
MAMIPESVVAEIIQRNNIVEVINSFVPLKKAGNGSWKACCPFHQEKTPSFHVSETKQLYYCFGCQKGGDAVKFMRDYLNLDYVEALQQLAQRAGVVIPQNVTPEEEAAYRKRRSEAGRMYDLHEALASFYRQELLQNPNSPVAQYFATRQIPGEYAEKFRIGAAPDSWDASITFLKSRGFTEQEIIAAGVAIEKSPGGRCYDRFRNRLVFAITDENNRVIGFSARIIVKDDTAPKYVNSPETAIFHKGSILYGLAQARDSIRRNKFAIVCEGQLDTIALHRAGLDMAVAPQGLAFRSEQAELIKRYTDKLYLCFDSDSAGQQGTLRVLEFLLPMNFEIYALQIAGGKDPDEIMRTQSADVLHDALKNAIPLTRIILNGLQRSYNLATPNGKVAAAEEAVKLLGAVPNPMLREAYFEEIASALRLPINRLFEFHRKQKRFADNTFSGNQGKSDAADNAPAKYNDMRSENIRHAEASLLLLALNSADGPRQIAECLDEKLLSDSPTALILKELMNMALNGEWFSGSELLSHLPEKLAGDPEVVKMLIRDVELTAEQCRQILEDCPRELQKDYCKRKSQELLYELRETNDIVRQAAILEELKNLRKQ